MYNVRNMKKMIIFAVCCMAISANASTSLPEGDGSDGMTERIDYYNSQAYRANERGDKAEAAKNFMLYLEEPARRGMSQAQQDSLYQADKRVYDQAALNAIYLYFSVNDMDGVLKALPYGRRVQIEQKAKPWEMTNKGITNVYVSGIEAAKAKGMNDLYIELLKEAVVRCPRNMSFTDQLTEYYKKNYANNMAGAQADLDKMISAHPDCPDAWYIKGTLYFDLQRNNSEARSCFSKAIAINEYYAYACAGMGNTYIEDINILRRQGQFKLVFTASNQQVKQSVYKKELAEAQTYFFNARTYYEMARELMPDNYSLWGEPLLLCYKMLNMQDKYDQLNKEMNEE